MTEQTNQPHFLGAVMGRYVIGNNPAIPGVNVFACRARYISPTRFIASAPVAGEVGDIVRAFFSPFGALRGTISRHVFDGFAVEIAASPSKQNQLAQDIIRFRNRTWIGVTDKRAEPRFMPGEPRSVVILSDGAVVPCLVIDFSSIGASVSADAHPAIGSQVIIGEVPGRVVRLFDVGFAVVYTSPQDEDVEEMLRAPRQWRDAICLARYTEIDLPDPKDGLADTAYPEM